jgi:hypothetical protein
LERDFKIVIANYPNVFSWFHEADEPYRAKLFRSARTTHGIVHAVVDARKRDEVVRFRHSARQPETREL